MLAHDAPLADILLAIVQGMEAERPTMLCSILLMTPDGMHLSNGASRICPTFIWLLLRGLPLGQWSALAARRHGQASAWW